MNKIIICLFILIATSFWNLLFLFWQEYVTYLSFGERSPISCLVMTYSSNRPEYWANLVSLDQPLFLWNFYAYYLYCQRIRHSSGTSYIDRRRLSNFLLSRQCFEFHLIQWIHRYFTLWFLAYFSFRSLWSTFVNLSAYVKVLIKSVSGESWELASSGW